MAPPCLSHGDLSARRGSQADDPTRCRSYSVNLLRSLTICTPISMIIRMDERERLLVITAHPGDFVWRAGGAIALAAKQGSEPVIACLSYGERGESAALWRQGLQLDQVKHHRATEAEAAASELGAELRIFDGGDYPLQESPEMIRWLVAIYREVQPTVVVTHPEADPYNPDHAAASALALKSRVFAQAAGFPDNGEPLGAPPVLCFEPHQPEICGFAPNVLLDITDVWETKTAAMSVVGAQSHLWEYYSDLGRRRGVQAQRNSSQNLGQSADSYAEAYQRVFPQVVDSLE